MPRAKRIKVLKYNSFETSAFEEEVNAYLADGWDLQGEMKVLTTPNGSYYTQVLVLYSEVHYTGEGIPLG